MILTEHQKRILDLPVETFIIRYMESYSRYAKVIVNAVKELTGCYGEEASCMKMRGLVVYSKEEWRKCKGVSKRCISYLDYAFEEAGISFKMDVTEEPELQLPSSSNSLNELTISTFEHLQQQLVKMGGSKTEFKMLRPDGFVWMLTVLPPGSYEE